MTFKTFSPPNHPLPYGDSDKGCLTRLSKGGLRARRASVVSPEPRDRKVAAPINSPMTQPDAREVQAN